MEQHDQLSYAFKGAFPSLRSGFKKFRNPKYPLWMGLHFGSRSMKISKIEQYVQWMQDFVPKEFTLGFKSKMWENKVVLMWYRSLVNSQQIESSFKEMFLLVWGIDVRACVQSWSEFYNRFHEPQVSWMQTLMDLDFILKIAPKLEGWSLKLRRVFPWILAWKWCYISTISLLHTLDPGLCHVHYKCSLCGRNGRVQLTNHGWKNSKWGANMPTQHCSEALVFNNMDFKW